MGIWLAFAPMPTSSSDVRSQGNPEDICSAGVLPILTSRTFAVTNKKEATTMPGLSVYFALWSSVPLALVFAAVA
jgi:hypothetical protein